jgi:hypothetical protein
MSICSMASSSVVPGFRDRLLEWVKVHDHEIDWQNAVLGSLSDVIRIVAHEQQPAVNLWVQRLYAAIEHLGKTGELRNLAMFHLLLLQKLRRPARRNNLDTEPHEATREFDDAGLVGNRNQSALNFHLRRKS